jgi:DNA-directed RNA polymerase specialized sigma24 family protein
MIVFGNLEGTEKKETTKLSEALSVGNAGNDGSKNISFMNFIDPKSFSTNTRIGKNENESEIVEKIMLGQTELFNKIDNCYRTDLLIFAKNKMRDFSIRDKHEASKEIVQQTLSNVLKIIIRGKYDNTMSMRGYLFTSTSRNCTLFKRENSALKLPKFFEDMTKKNYFGSFENEGIENKTNQLDYLTEESRGKIGEVFDKLDVGEIGRIMQELKPKFRNVIELKFFSNLTHKEISQTLDITISQSQDRCQYGLLNLRKLIEKRILSKV